MKIENYFSLFQRSAGDGECLIPDSRLRSLLSLFSLSLCRVLAVFGWLRVTGTVETCGATLEKTIGWCGYKH
jgi:hypothetical protein